MKLTSWSDILKTGKASNELFNASIGVFDGIHLGHQKLLKRLSDHLEKSLVVTFRNNPKEILRSQLFGGHLSSWAEKLQRLEDLGIDEVLWIDFSTNFATMTAEVFLQKLQEFYSLRNFVLGWNFRLGRHPGLGVAELENLLKNGKVEVIEPVFYQQILVSSSEVRKSIHNGQMDLAAKLLGRSYRIEVHEAEYRHGGYWVSKTACKQVVPKEGAYPVFAGRKSILNVEKDGMFWESPPGPVAKEIIFEE